MDWVLLCQPNVVMNVRVSCQFCDFGMGAMSQFVAYPANVNLPVFNSSELLHKVFLIRAAISSLGGTVFKFTLEKSVSEKVT